MPLYALAAVPQISGGNTLELVLVLVLLILCLAIHEVAHGWVALKCGDPTARDLGRLTLNPVPHIDLFMTIILPAMLFFMSQGRVIFGGAKPVPVDFHRLRHPWRDMSLVALAGPLSNLLLAVLFVAALNFFVSSGLYNNAAATPYERQFDLLPRVLEASAGFNILLTVFNLIPVPPLDGSRVMAWLLPQGLRPAYVGLERYGLLIVFALIYLSPGFNRYLGMAKHTVRHAIDSVLAAGGLG